MLPLRARRDDEDLDSAPCYNPISYGATAHTAAFNQLDEGAHVFRVQAQPPAGPGAVTTRAFAVDTSEDFLTDDQLRPGGRQHDSHSMGRLRLGGRAVLLLPLGARR